MIREREYAALPGLPMAIGLILVMLASAYGIFDGGRTGSLTTMLLSTSSLVLAVFLLAGLFVVNPNEAKVLQFFGDYVGSVRIPGLRWAYVPRREVRVHSLRVRYSSVMPRTK